MDEGERAGGVGDGLLINRKLMIVFRVSFVYFSGF